MAGLLVSVMKDVGGSDCSNNGISSKAEFLCVVNIRGPFEPDENNPAAWLETSKHGVVRLVPAEMYAGQWRPIPKWWMNGGNVAATSDSRYSEAVALHGVPHGCAIPIFDRSETAQQSRDLSQ
jgi:hypothetical protein